MAKYIYIILISFIVTGCAGFQNASLTDEQPLVQLDSAVMNAPSIPVLEVNKGIFYDRNSDLSKWEGSHSNIGVARIDTSLVVLLKDVGVDWEMITLKFKPMDFTKATDLLMKARVEGKNFPRIRIDLVDDEGRFTNFVPQQNTIVTLSDSVYKFSFGGNFIQNWPVRADVDQKRIVEIRINFNGGGPNFKGRVFIDRLWVVPKNS